MTEIASLIALFKAEDTQSLDDMDKSQKPAIIRKLEAFAADDDVLDFLLSVALNEQEFDLARIEVLKVLELIDISEPEVRNRIAGVVRNVLSESNESLVRVWAAITAASYMDVPDVSSVIERILQDASADVDLRWNAFAAFKSMGPTQQSIRVIRGLLNENEFKTSAARVLSEWQDSKVT